MARQAGNGETASTPIKLRPSIKKRLADWQGKQNLGTFDDAISILLDIAETFGKNIEIQTEPSITIREASKEESGDGVHSS